MDYILYMCAFLFSILLCSMGYDLSTWQFWAATILYLIPVGFAFYKDGVK